MASPDSATPKQPSRFHFPSAYTILFVLIVIVAALTWIIPAGQYERVASDVLGKDIPVAGTYSVTAANPQGFFDVILAPIGGFYDPASYTAKAIDVALFVLMIGGFIGLVPRQNSSGGKDRLGRITKMGNGYLRRLLVVGATSVVRRAETTNSKTGAWVRSLLERKPTRLVTVAIANKTARTAWALLAKEETYHAAPAA